MKALISKIEPRQTGYRVAQVVEDGHEFPVASDLFWHDCDNTVVADHFWFDPSNNTIKEIPIPQTVAANNQPTVSGAQTL